MASWRANNVTLGGNRTSTSVTMPTGAAVGDMLVGVADIENDHSPTYTPTSFTALQNVDHAGAAFDLWSQWRLFTGTEGTLTFTTSLTWTSWLMFAIQNASTTIAPVASAAAQGSGTTATPNAVTPVGDNACLIAVYVGFGELGVVTPTATWTERQDANDNIYAQTKNLGAGTAGVSQAGPSITITSGTWIATQIVVEDVATVAAGAKAFPFRARRLNRNLMRSVA